MLRPSFSFSAPCARSSRCPCEPHSAPQLVSDNLSRLPTLGRYFFGLGMVAFGVMQLVRNDLVRLAPKLSATAPLPELWPRLTGIILVFGGAMILGRKWVRGG